MIFVDTNVFLRFLMPVATHRDPPMKAAARALFDTIQTGEIRATTSEVALHEVCFLLGSKAHYDLAPFVVVQYLQAILSWPGWWFPAGDHALYLRALEVFLDHPKLGFADSVIAVRSEALGSELATFDRRLAALPFITAWSPKVDQDI